MKCLQCIHILEEFRYHFTGCDFSKISCRLLHHLTEKDTFVFEHYSDIDEATIALSQGTILGYIYFPANFSEAFFERLIRPMDINVDTLNESTVQASIEIYT